MKLSNLAVLLALAAGSLADVYCYQGGQAFDEQWSPSRIILACDRLSGILKTGQIKSTCEPLGGSDHVSIAVHNKVDNKKCFTKRACRRGIRHIIRTCGGFGDSVNYGGHSAGETFDIKFNPTKGACTSS